LSDIILKAMAKHPAARFQTSEEFRQSLDQLCGEPQTVSTQVLEPMQVAEPQFEVAPPADAEEFDSAVYIERWNSWGLLAAGAFVILVFTWAFLVVIRHL
jgi:hypothetical protein